jgi:hypothetical protein
MKKKLFYLLGLVIFTVAMAWLSTRLLAAFWISPVLDEVFRESVSYYSDGLYKVTYQDMNISPLEQQVEFTDFRLSYDSSRVVGSDSLRQRKWVSVELDNLLLNLGNLWTMIPGRYLDVEELTVRKPRISIDAYAVKRDSFRLQKISDFDAHQLISEYFDSLRVDQLAIEKAALGWYQHDHQQDFSIGNINAAVGSMLIDSATSERNLGYPLAETFQVEVNNVRFFSPDSLYAIRLGSVQADPVAETLLVSSFSLEPQLPEYEFARHVGQRTDRVSLEVAEISLSGIDLHYLLSDQAILTQNISVKAPELRVFKDKRLERIAGPDKPMLQQVLKNIPIPFRLDTLELKEGSIIYKEHVKEGKSSGQIVFDPLYMTAYHITNLPQGGTTELQADIRTRLMDASWLDLRIRFPLADKNGSHRLSGKLASMSLDVLNPMLEATAFTSISSGYANELRFDMSANSLSSRGEVYFLYNDLKIDMLKKDEADSKARLGSFIANTFVVKTDNPAGQQSPRVGIIAFDREKDRSIFSYWWKSLLTGIKGSIGLAGRADRDKEKEQDKGIFQKIFGKKKD